MAHILKANAMMQGKLYFCWDYHVMGSITTKSRGEQAVGRIDKINNMTAQLVLFIWLKQRHTDNEIGIIIIVSIMLPGSFFSWFIRQS